MGTPGPPLATPLTTKAVRTQRKHSRKLLTMCTKDTRQSLQYGLPMGGQARDRLKWRLSQWSATEIQEK